MAWPALLFLAGVACLGVVVMLGVPKVERPGRRPADDNGRSAR